MTGYCLNQSQQQDLMDNNFRYTFRTFCKKSYSLQFFKNTEKQKYW